MFLPLLVLLLRLLPERETKKHPLSPCEGQMEQLIGRRFTVKSVCWLSAKRWSRAFSDLVRFDEPDEHGEEHGGRSRLRVLSEVLDGRVVRVLQEREQTSAARDPDTSHRLSTIKVYFLLIKVDLGRLPVGGERAQQLRVAAEERLENGIFFFHGELPPGHLRPSLQSTDVLQDGVQRNYDTQTPHRVKRLNIKASGSRSSF